MWRVFIAVAAFSFEALALSSLLVEPLPFSLGLSAPLDAAVFFVGAMAKLCTEPLQRNGLTQLTLKGCGAALVLRLTYSGLN